jgi:hypothetical protein
MDKQEARQLLLQQLRPYLRWSYDRLRALLGGEHVTEIRGQTGCRYFFEVHVSRPSEAFDDLEVEGIISEVEGRRSFPPNVTASFCLSPDGRLHSRTPDLMDGR